MITNLRNLPLSVPQAAWEGVFPSFLRPTLHDNIQVEFSTTKTQWLTSGEWDCSATVSLSRCWLLLFLLHLLKTRKLPRNEVGSVS